MEAIKTLLELFPYALAGGVLAGAILSFLGVFVVSQRAVFLGAVLTQTAIAGVAFSFLHIIDLEKLLQYLLGITISKESFLHTFEPEFYSLFFAFITVLIFSQTYRLKDLTQDIVLGIIFVLAISLRIIFIQKSPAAEVAEIESLLKGDILFISAKEFYTLNVILIVSALVFFIFRRQLKFVTFDPATASAHGLNSRFWLFIFYLIVGLSISLTTRIVGDVFAFAYLIIPSSIGILLARKVSSVFLISITAGAIFPPISLYAAFKLDISSGPTAVILIFLIFIFVLVFKKFKH